MPQVQLARRAPGHFILSVDGVAHDVRFPPTGNLEPIVLQILSGKEYPTLRLPGWSPRTILDIGANVGATALFFALAWPEARIRCWEPSPSTARILADNVAWLPQVEVNPVGLHAEHRTVPLYGGTAQCAQQSVALSVETREDAFETIELVPAREAIGTLEGPVLLKIDTEGCEVPVLRDIADQLDQIDVVYLEYHSEADRRALDALLGDRFALWKAKAHHVHRGTCAYLHRRLLEAHPELGILEIRAELPEPAAV